MEDNGERTPTNTSRDSSPKTETKYEPQDDTEVTDDTEEDSNIKTKYDLGKKGLFVFIINQRFGYADKVQFPPGEDHPGPYRDLNKDIAEQDKKNLLQIVPSHYKKHEDILIGENLRPTQAVNQLYEDDDKVHYEAFLRKVERKVKEKQPSFVFVYVSSHGGDDCTFLLAGHDDVDDMCDKSCNDTVKHTNETVHYSKKPIDDSKPKCKHSPTCHRRSFDVLVSRIQNIEGDSHETYTDEQGNEKRVKVMCGKPKIFLADFCRYGADAAGLHLAFEPGQPMNLEEPRNRNSHTVHMIPGADTIILYATLQYKYTFEKIPFTETFRKLVENLTKLSTEDMDLLHNEVQHSSLRKMRTDRNMTSFEVEDFVDGWLLDVFNQVCHDVGYKLSVFEKEITTQSGEEIDSHRRDKQVPEICSTLTLKLSAIDMFRELKDASVMVLEGSEQADPKAETGTAGTGQETLHAVV